MMYHMYILCSFNIVQNIPVDVLIFRGRINFNAWKIDEAENSNSRFKTSKNFDLKKTWEWRQIFFRSNVFRKVIIDLFTKFLDYLQKNYCGSRHLLFWNRNQKKQNGKEKKRKYSYSLKNSPKSWQKGVRTLKVIASKKKYL